MSNFPGANLFENIPDVIKPIAYDISSQIGDIQPAYYFDITLLSNNNFQIKVPRVKHFSIHEEFELNVCDYINLTVQLPIDSIKLLESRYKDLKCQVKIFCGDPNASTLPANPKYNFTWIALLKNRGSVFKNVTPAQLNNNSGEWTEKDQLVDIELQLYNPGAIKIRQRKTAGVFRNATVEQMLYFVCSHIGVERLDLIPPHNTLTYENFIIDPMHYLNDIFDYIQQRYGVYQQGISTYYFGINDSDSCLFVYPPYHYDCGVRENDIVIEVLYVGQGNLSAGAKQHKVYPKPGYDVEYNGVKHHISGGMKILCSDVVAQYTNADAGAEDIGTLTLLFNANKTIDRWRDIEIDGKNLCIPKHKSVIIDTMKNGFDFTGFTSTHYNPRYDVSYNNAYVSSSKLASVDYDVTVFKWYGAEPWTFEPGKRVLYSYGKDTSKYVTQVPGIVSEVVYVFTPIPANKPGHNYCTCTAEVMLKQKREA